MILSEEVRSFEIRHYLSIARPDHWFKNIFMLLGSVLAFFLQPGLIFDQWYLKLAIAFTSTCLIASSNYVINELLDAPRDSLHPTKRFRPIPSGKIFLPFAYMEWILLFSIGLWLAYKLNFIFFLSALSFFVAGILYNVPPIRTKDLPYIDVLSEAINNPIRLCLGWFCLIPGQIPPISLLIAYWMVGAFFMGAKRFAEYKMINDPEVAGNYRSSFRYYNYDRLLLTQFFYSTFCAFFFGIFIVRYHLELILIVPLFASFFAYYMKLALKPDSPVQAPEKLYKQYFLLVHLSLSLIAFVFLLFIHIQVLYDLFNVVPNKIPALWKF